MAEEKKSYHRGRRDKKKKGGILSTLVLIVALAVFLVSGFQLFQIFSEYRAGEKEYEKIQQLAITQEDPDAEGGFKLDFDALKEINPDTVAWIRFDEPSIINYPVVHGTDNETYLTKTFEANDNKLGTLFVDKDNTGTFKDKNTFIYGHNMKNKTMFAKLMEYKEKSYWEKYPYFYIYTPDGQEHVYKIYSAGIVKDTSDSYIKAYNTDEEFEQYIALTKEASLYDTGVEVTKDSKIVSLSTCTNVRDDERFLVHGVEVETKEAK